MLQQVTSGPFQAYSELCRSGSASAITSHPIGDYEKAAAYRSLPNDGAHSPVPHPAPQNSAKPMKIGFGRACNVDRFYALLFGNITKAR